MKLVGHGRWSLIHRRRLSALLMVPATLAIFVVGGSLLAQPPAGGQKRDSARTGTDTTASPVPPSRPVDVSQITTDTISTGELLRVFLDCQLSACDFDHVRREIPFVNYVRDREDADLHVLVTSQRAAAGTQYTIHLLGRKQFLGSDDTLHFAASETTTRQAECETLTQTLQLGLIRYVAKTPAAARLRITYLQPAALARPTPPDPWNLWVFRVALSGSADGEESAQSYSISGDASARRTSETWKLTLAGVVDYRRSSFDLGEPERFVSISRSVRARALMVRAIAARWSTGARTSVTTSSYQNEDMTVRVAPAVEYSVFPYSESTSRQLRFQYYAGPNFFRYEEETIFGKTREVIYSEGASADLLMTQPWGSANFTLEGAHYLPDLTHHHVSLSGSTDIRVFRGLGITLYGSAARIADQLGLRRGGATDEEILLRRRELPTSFRYFVSLGFSYTFGSTYTNIVNPRMGQ